MSNRIVILTATYNHGKNIPTLYKSLTEQDSKDFRWIVVNDGSKDDTDDVIKGFLKENLIEIDYISKLNSGKSSSLNLALDKIAKDEMVVIVDDDECLDKDAVTRIGMYYDKYKDSSVGVIHFQRRNAIDMKPIANYDISDDLKQDYINFKNSGKSADGYLSYFGDAIENMRFPHYEGEKYVAPGILIMSCCEKYDMIWAKEVIGTTEYLEGGITKQGRRLRVRNPLGMMKYCEMFQRKGVPLKIRVKCSIMGYAYKKISKKSNSEIKANGIQIGRYVKVTKPLGFLLGVYWKKKYAT